jgi:hypothetical protein
MLRAEKRLELDEDRAYAILAFLLRATAFDASGFGKFIDS